MFYLHLCNSNKRQNGSATTSYINAQFVTRIKKKKRGRGVARKYRVTIKEIDTFDVVLKRNY